MHRVEELATLAPAVAKAMARKQDERRKKTMFNQCNFLMITTLGFLLTHAVPLCGALLTSEQLKDFYTYSLINNARITPFHTSQTPEKTMLLIPHQKTETQKEKIQKRQTYTIMAHTIDLTALGCLLYALYHYQAELYKPNQSPEFKTWFFDFTPYINSLNRPLLFACFFAQESIRVIVYKTIAKAIAWYATHSFKETWDELAHNNA